ncbi:hypothetical protein MPH_08934 [Macrophomina phaseolina MS6]|uniref:Uncharacterized protein n=1 Tax=Macrophomina phaseolina (strain MS6) TaxID=1126212 RepID=K2SAM5_MACPH|nr:hypothetical protein MPH_08934 [Macrophomina phaseolina MS6]
MLQQLPVGGLAFEKFDACQIFPGSFINLVCDSDDFGIMIPLFAEWCDKWIKEHSAGLFASKEFEKAIGDGGFAAKTLMKLVASHYPRAGTEGSKKRGVDGEDTEWSAKAPKTGERAVLHVSR